MFFVFYFISFTFPFHLLYFPFLIKQIRNIICRNCKQDVGAGVNILMSISDGLGPSIFCRKMEEARPMKEELDG